MTKWDKKFLVKFLVVEALHICIDTPDNIEDDSDDDDQPWSWDEKVYITRGSYTPREEGDYLGSDIGEYCDKCKESSSEEIESIRHTLEKCRCLLSWADSRDISSTLLDTFSDFSRIECDRYIEKWESEN